MNQSSLMARINDAVTILKQLYPRAHCALNYETPFQLLVATILSAQCTDTRVNEVTRELFKYFSDPKDILKLSVGELEELIKPAGFFRQKAKYILGAAAVLTKDHEGLIPPSLEVMVRLPGVGRKTANVVLSELYQIPGITVDTHVKRVSRRLGWTEEDDPVKIEFALQRAIPLQDWSFISHALIWHGRQICKARKPLCAECPLSMVCNFIIPL